MRKVELTQTDTLTWAASSAGIAGDIEKRGVLTRIVATAEVTPSALMAGANAPDGIWQVLQNFRVLGGGQTYFTLPVASTGGHGGTLLHFINAIDHAQMSGVPRGTLITAPQRTYHPFTWVFHPGGRPRMWGRENPFDLTAFIPAGQESQLRMEWATTANTIMDDTVTITSAVMRLTLYYILGTHDELVQEQARQGVALPGSYMAEGATGMVPAWTAEVTSPTATAADYTNERNIPTGYYMKRVSVMSQDDTATRPLRVQDEVTGMRIHIDGDDVCKAFVDGWVNMMGPCNADEDADAALDFGNHAGVGVAIKDLRPHGNADYGLNLRHVATGSARVGVTITTNAAGDDNYYLYEGYKPYFGRLE